MLKSSLNGDWIRGSLAVSHTKEFKLYSVVIMMELLMVYKEGSGLVRYDLTSL